jgi:hypothetical protein
VKVLLVARALAELLARRRSSYVPGNRLLGRTNGHDPEARGLFAVLEQLTYIQSMKAVFAALG